MNITIFGASSIVGMALINQCIWKSHQVVAFARNIHEIEIESDHLSFVKAGIFDQNEIGFALKNADIIFSVLGGAIDGDDKTRSVGMKNIIAQMKKYNKKRIIVLGGYGCLQFDDEMLLMETENFPKEQQQVSEEHLKVMEMLETSDLDYTLVCPYNIIDAEITGNYEVKEDFLINNNAIIASDLAQFMLTESEKNQYLKTKISICN